MTAGRTQLDAEVNKPFCVQFLRQYHEIRQKNLASDGVTSTAYSTATKVMNFMTGQANNDDYVKTIDTFIDRINKLESFSEHISLIKELSSCANKSQLSKFNIPKQLNLTDKESLFALFLHALRNYIVSTLKHPQSPFAAEFNAHIAKLESDYVTFKTDLITAREHPNPYIGNVKSLTDKRDNTILELAYLDISEYTHMVVDFKLLEHYRHLNDGAGNMLNCLQPDFMEKF
jgi:hypothetical protein